jgi:hypothetical protein
MARLLLLLAAVGFVLAACEPAPDEEPRPCMNPEPGVAQLGESDDAMEFVPVQEYAEVAVQFGPQGQHMLTLSDRIEGMERASAGGVGHPMNYAIRVDDELVGGFVSDGLSPSETDGDIDYFHNIRGIFQAAEVEPLLGEVAEIEMTVGDGCGRPITATMLVTLVE